MPTTMPPLTQQLLNLFPELKALTAPGEEGLPYVMMGHLLEWVRVEMKAGRMLEVAPRVEDFTAWCEDQPEVAHAQEDIATLYTKGFYEKLFAYEETRPLVTRLTTKQELSRPEVREYFITHVGQEAYDETLALFDTLPPSVRDLWRKAKAVGYPWTRFSRVMAAIGVAVFLGWVVIMVPEIRGYHAYADLMRGQVVPVRKLVVHRPEEWELTDEDSLRYIVGHLKRRVEQQGRPDDIPAAGTLVFGPWKRVSYTDIILSRDGDYMLLMHDDFGHEYFYRIPIDETAPQPLRGMVYGLGEYGRFVRAQQEAAEQAEEEAVPDNRMKLPGQPR